VRVEERIEALVVLAAGADEPAWRELWATIEPALLQIIAQPRFLGRLGRQLDDQHNIALAVMARLRADRWHRLQLYLDARQANPELRFLSWLRVVAKRVGIDYLRAHPEYLRHDSDASTPGHWVEQGTLPPDSQLGGARPPVTNRGTARELLELAASFPTDQRRALELWAHGESFAAIARALAMKTEIEAQRTVRAAIERLRRHYREVSAA
jgi:DNA-directed RNA polymerase specialized sigma24 family protein